MADGEITLKIDGARAERLKAAADLAGKSVEDYALSVIDNTLDDNWDWDAIERICDETEREGTGVPLEAVKAWVKSWGTEHELPIPMAK